MALGYSYLERRFSYLRAHPNQCTNLLFCRSRQIPSLHLEKAMSINRGKRSRLIQMYDNHRLALLPIAEAGKRPLTKNGYKDATSSRRAIRKWFADWLYANVAVATGAA